jgi:hypothetical protein
MALFIRQNEQRSKLQERLAAELQERAKQRAIDDTPPDHVKDSRYIEHTTHTGRHAWVWLVVVGLLIVCFILYVVLRVNQ